MMAFNTVVLPVPGEPVIIFPDGYTMSVDWESYKEFDTNPAFGKA